MYALIFFTLVLPVARVLALFACWHMPPKLLSVHLRENVLLQFAISQKIEAFSTLILIFVIGGTHFSYHGVDQFGDKVSFFVENSPRYAFFAPFGAYIIGQGVCDAMLHAHYRAEAHDGHKDGLEVGFQAEPGALLDQVRTPLVQAKSRLSKQANLPFSLVAWFCVLAAPVLVLLGCFMTSWTVTWGGLFGILKY